MTNESEWKAVAERLSRGPAAVHQPPPPAPTTATKFAFETNLLTKRFLRTNKEYSTDEERNKATDSMFEEYLSSADKKEAILCAEEIIKGDDSASKKLVMRGQEQLFNCLSDRDREKMVDLLIQLAKDGIIETSIFVEALKEMASQLDDLSLDIPKSPELCGRLLGKAISEGVTQMELLPSMCDSILSAEVRFAKCFNLGVWGSFLGGL